MNIKYTFTLLLLSFLSITSVAQDYKANIKQRFTEYCGYLRAGEFDKSLDYVSDAIFTVVPRAQMVAIFEQMLNGKEMEVRFISFDIKDIADSRKIDTCYYAKVKYLTVMTMKMNPGKIESAADKANRVAMTKQAFTNAFGSDNVKLDEATETYTLTAAKNSWAISKNGQTGWKFINVEPNQRLIMEKILPKELINESIN